MTEILNMAMSVHARYMLPFVVGLMVVLLSDHVVAAIYSMVGAGKRRRN